MDLDSLKTEDIIQSIKSKPEEANHSQGGYIFFDGTKLSPGQFFRNVLKVENCGTGNTPDNTNYNVYAKLLSIISELNNEAIYLHIGRADRYNINKDLYELQLKYIVD